VKTNARRRLTAALSNASKTVSTLIIQSVLATDDLRKEHCKFGVQSCQMEREKQLMDKKRLAEQKIMEEQVYA